MVPTRRRIAVRACAFLPAIVLLASTPLAAPNVPSINQVYQAARAGHLDQAEAMTRQVLKVYPNSARPNYVMAQILAAEGRTGEAQTYLENAERLKPGLPFANPQSVANLKRRISNGDQSPVTRPSTNQIHWWWLLVGAFVLFVLWRARRRSSVPSRNYNDVAPGGGAAGPWPGMHSSGYGGGGFLRSVLGGLGFGAGAAAGERAMDRFFGREQQGPTQQEISDPSSDSGNLGGDAFGVQPGESSSGGWEDSGDQSNVSSNPDDLGASDSGDGGWGDSSSSGDGGWDDSSSGGKQDV